jgi:hypothetical protein
MIEQPTPMDRLLDKGCSKKLCSRFFRFIKETLVCFSFPELMIVQMLSG